MVVEALHLNLPSCLLQPFLDPLARAPASLAARDPGAEFELLRNQIVGPLPIKRTCFPARGAPCPNRRAQDRQGHGKMLQRDT